MTKTTAAILEQINQPLSFVELDLPALQRGQVLVEVHYSGLCHSQLNEIRGLKGEDKYLPHTLGHEGSGIVKAIGEGVTKVKPGDKVVLTWIKGKGLDASGPAYTHQGRKINSGPISTFLKDSILAENRLVPIPADFPLREAALLGCAIATGAGVIFNQMKIQAGQTLGIFGLGGIGLSALIAAHHLGAITYAIDIQEHKLAQARALGASHALPFDAPLPPLDFALECAGKKQVMEHAFRSVKPNGGLCVIAGNLPKGETISIDPFDLIIGKRILGSWGGSSQIDADIARYTSLKLPLASLITHEVPLEQLNDLVAALIKGQVGRGLVKMK